MIELDFVPKAIPVKINEEKLKIRQLSDRDFEYYIANMFKKLGYDAEVTPATNDGGKDIVLSKYGKQYFVECKHFSEENMVGRPIVQKAFGAAVVASVAGCFIVTSSRLNSNALEEAARNDMIYTMDIDDIAYLNVFPYGYVQDAYNCPDKEKYSKLKQQYLKSADKLDLTIQGSATKDKAIIKTAENETRLSPDKDDDIDKRVKEELEIYYKEKDKNSQSKSVLGIISMNLLLYSIGIIILLIILKFRPLNIWIFYSYFFVCEAIALVKMFTADKGNKMAWVLTAISYPIWTVVMFLFIASVASGK